MNTFAELFVPLTTDRAIYSVFEHGVLHVFQVQLLRWRSFPRNCPAPSVRALWAVCYPEGCPGQAQQARPHAGDTALGRPRELSRGGRGARWPWGRRPARLSPPGLPGAEPCPRAASPRAPRRGAAGPGRALTFLLQFSHFICGAAAGAAGQERAGREVRPARQRQPGPRCLPAVPAALCYRARPAGRSRGGPAALTCPAIPRPGIAPRTLRAAPSGLGGDAGRAAPAEPRGEGAPAARTESGAPAALQSPPRRGNGRTGGHGPQLISSSGIKTPTTAIPPRAPAQPGRGQRRCRTCRRGCACGRRAGGAAPPPPPPPPAAPAGLIADLRRRTYAEGRPRPGPHLHPGPHPCPHLHPGPHPGSLSRPGPPGRTDPLRLPSAPGSAAGPCPRLRCSSVISYEGFLPLDFCFFLMALKWNDTPRVTKYSSITILFNQYAAISHSCDNTEVAAALFPGRNHKSSWTGLLNRHQPSTVSKAPEY